MWEILDNPEIKLTFGDFLILVIEPILIDNDKCVDGSKGDATSAAGHARYGEYKPACYSVARYGLHRIFRTRRDVAAPHPRMQRRADRTLIMAYGR